jgi:hypothetical protein
MLCELTIQVDVTENWKISWQNLSMRSTPRLSMSQTHTGSR